MRLFIILVCCLAIPLVAPAADQNGKTKKKQSVQGQKQAATKGTHHNANTAAQPNNPSHVKGQTHSQAGNTHNNNGPTTQRPNNDKKANKQHYPNTAAQPNNRSHVKGPTHSQAGNTHNNNTSVVRSATNDTMASKHHRVNTAEQLNNPAHAKTDTHSQRLNAHNNNVPAVQSNTAARVQARHFNLSHSPNSTIQSATFHENYRIHGSEQWQGRNYEAFQNYRGEWHDRGWWHNHYDRIVLISGGWYFLNAGYWAPAWGYNSGAAYYPYNGPIYAYNNLPPDQVIANVQSTLQARGYYQGEVDGLLGPITRSALANYQGDNGLYTTEAIDEPTLRSLGMS